MPDWLDARGAALEDSRPRCPARTLAAELDAVAAQHPERPFVIAGEQTLTDGAAGGHRRAAEARRGGRRPGAGRRLVAYKTVDPFDGSDLPPGTEGELAARGPILTRGYHRGPDETAAVLDAAGWLRSGDLGRIRPDGYLALTGRSKELYKCGTELVMPNEVEARLCEHPDVGQA